MVLDVLAAWHQPPQFSRCRTGMAMFAFLIASCFFFVQLSDMRTDTMQTTYINDEQRAILESYERNAVNHGLSSLTRAEQRMLHQLRELLYKQYRSEAAAKTQGAVHAAVY
jgi:hypothetical protein